MRAVILKQEISFNDVGTEVALEGDSARHLIKVIRIKKNEKILLLNGQGLKSEVEVKYVDRKSLRLKINSVISAEDNRRISLFLGLPKKDAFESIVRMSSEIGIRNIYLYRSEYSQQDIEINDRIEKIEESAITQSNNPFRLKFIKVTSFEEAFSSFNKIVHFSTFSEGEVSFSNLDEEVLIVIGPEAGFSPSEESEINSYENVSIKKLDTNIMRAPTALAVASGYILNSF